MDNKFEISLLFDFYSMMLTDTQRECISLYYNDDLSLKETADILGISRQGVRDALSRAKKSLYEYEQRLGLCARYSKIEQGLELIISKADDILGCCDDENIKAMTAEILSTAQNLYEQEV